MAQTALVAALLALLAVGAYCQSMVVRSGKVVDLKKLYQESKGQCCLDWTVLGKENGVNSIVHMDGSGGKYYVTNDPNCGNVIYSSSYPTSFQKIYLCGQCKGGCPQVDGGKTLVPAGGSCKKSDGSYDISKECIASHPVCSDAGKCITVDEALNTPKPCSSFATLSSYCDERQGKCCGGAPKNAKCENYKCVSTYPSPTPPSVSCSSFATLSSYCDERQGKCCGGTPKNAKCENNKCVSTYPSGK